MRPGCGAQRTARISLATGGFMSQFQPLSIGGKYHAVIANYITAAQRGKTYGATFTGAGNAITSALGHRAEADAAALRHRPPQA